jgi:hypothetical protein
MLLTQLIFGFVVSFALAYLFSAVFDRRGPWGTTWSMALVAFGFVMAAGMWVAPFGPAIAGFYPAPFVIPALLIMLLFAAVPMGVQSQRPTTEGSVTGDIALGLTFWGMMLALAAVTVAAVVTSTAGVV